MRVYMDGNMWCATYDDFEDLQVSPAGFGETPELAIEALKKETAMTTEVKTLEQLADEVYNLSRQIESDTETLKVKKQELTMAIIEAGQDQAVSSSGIGFKLSKTPGRYEYKRPVLDYLEDKGLLEHFTPAPKVTKTKLDELLKAGALDYSDLAQIEQWTIVTDGEVSVRQFVAKAVL